MKYFVTGATGFVGSRVVRQLLAAGHEVTALVRSADGARTLEASGIRPAVGDITDRRSLEAPMRGVDGVFHLAGWYKIGVPDKSPAVPVNVEGTRNVLETMQDLGTEKGVYTSTLAVFSDTKGQLVEEGYRHAGPWLSEYDRTKWIAHYEVAEPMIRRGLPLVIVQPGVTYGSGDRGPTQELFARYLRGSLPAVPRKVAYCWGHVEDTARGHILAMERGRVGESYILAGPAHTLLDALSIAERITGIPVPRRRPSPATMRILSALMGVAGQFVDLPVAYRRESLRVLAGVTYLGTSAKAKRELGFRSRSLEEGLRDTLAHEIRRLGMETPGRRRRSREKPV